MAAFHCLNFPPAWYKAASNARVQAEYGAADANLRGRRKDGLRLKADDAAALASRAAADGGGCGSCYGAAEEVSAATRSCDDARKAYRRKGWSFDNHGHQIDGIALRTGAALLLDEAAQY